ncbi:MAG: hypothetical protein AABW64_04205 [Nanoarchaeota archaeon]
MHGKKRGQATPFVIAGLVIFILVVLLFYLRGSLFLGTVTLETLQDTLSNIDAHVDKCVHQVGDEPIRRIGLQGGHLSLAEDTFRKYNDISISYLCYNRDNDPRCYNRMLTVDEMERELSQAIQQGLKTCVNVKKFTRGLDAQIGSFTVATDIGQDVVTVLVTMPVVLKKGELRAAQDKFTASFSYPLGRLYQVNQDIITIETIAGEFEQLSYMLSHQGQYIIEKKKPYPDKLYILTTKDSPYIFQFFVQGEPSV